MTDIPVRQWGEERLKDPAFKAAYDALEDEFALAVTRLRISFEPEAPAEGPVHR